MAEAGIGVDIVEIARFERILQTTPSFAQRFFSEEEQAYCNSKARPAAHYACRFAAREAVLKALGTGFSQGVGRKDVCVSRDAQGKPHAVLSGRALEISQELGIDEVALSLSFTSELAIANAMALTQAVRPAPKPNRQDDRAVIAQSFREARGLIDELERVTLVDFTASSDAADSGERDTDLNAGPALTDSDSDSDSCPPSPGDKELSE